CGTSPHVGLIPQTPVKLAGIRMDPPPSVPVASGPIPAATAAAAPPLEPPGVVDRSHGFLVTPVSGLSVTPFHAISGVVVFPTKTAPCSRSRAVTGESSVHGPSCGLLSDPFRVGQPLAR